MAKIQKIEDHATVTVTGKRSAYNQSVWRCNYCSFETNIYYDDFKNMRAHLRRMHPIQYKPFTINEELDHEEILAGNQAQLSALR